MRSQRRGELTSHTLRGNRTIRAGTVHLGSADFVIVDCCIEAVNDRFSHSDWLENQLGLSKKKNVEPEKKLLFILTSSHLKISIVVMARQFCTHVAWRSQWTHLTPGFILILQQFPCYQSTVQAIYNEGEMENYVILTENPPTIRTREARISGRFGEKHEVQGAER